jgi:hypothetical protein
MKKNNSNSIIYNMKHFRNVLGIEDSEIIDFDDEQIDDIEAQFANFSK